MGVKIRLTPTIFDKLVYGNPLAGLSEGDEAEDEPGEDESGGEGADDVLGEPADEFLNLLLNRYYEDAVSAQFVCLLCHYAGAMGAPESVARLGKGPGYDSGAYQKHLSRRRARSTCYVLDVCALPNTCRRRPNAAW